MAQEGTTAVKLTVPPEIWRIVLHSFGTQPRDLVELWTGCRGVSKFFKYEIEELFIAQCLPHTFLLFDLTTSQGFDRNSRIEFHDFQVQTRYSHVSVNRNSAFFQAEDDNGTRLLQQMHNGGDSSAPSHLVNLWRSSDNVDLPGVFFQADGSVEVGWRELFAAVLAEEKYHYQTGWNPIEFQVLYGADFENEVVASRPEELSRKAEIFESNTNKAKQAEAPGARVFYMTIARVLDCT